MANPKRPVALALAGGNALGAYGAGAYEALHERGYLPDVVSGASIGAVNGGIIAGNRVADRIGKLREFWAQAGSASALASPSSGRLREYYNSVHAVQSLLFGRPGLFTPRLPGLLSILPGMPPDLGIFDSKPLVSTLERVIDFGVLNSAELPLVIGTVDMIRGEPVLFDTRKGAFDPRHFLATTAFTPGFPPVEIDGRSLADPGLISNLPIDAILDPPPTDDLLVFAVDLFDSVGQRPRSIDTGLERAQDILFSAQSRGAIEARSREQRLRRIIGELSTCIPPEERTAHAQLTEEGRTNEIALVLIAYRAPPHELSAKMVEFSKASINERWAAGRADMNDALYKLEAEDATVRHPGYSFYDARRRERGAC
jgi:NTE family protein